MRYIAIALAALLVSVPTMAAAGGPDALSIAKRALRLAKESPKVEYVVGRVIRQNQSPPGFVYRATCPHGMLPVNVLPEFRPSAVWIRGRSIHAFEDQDGSGRSGFLLGVCIESDSATWPPP